MSSFAVVSVADPALASCFTQTELRRYKVQFDTTKGAGRSFLTSEELKQNSERLGFKQKLSDADVAKVLDEFDRSSVGGLTFEDFLRLQADIDTGSSYFSPLSKPRSQAGGVSRDFMRSPVYSTVHVVNESEKEAYVEHINSCLADDPHVGTLLPISTSGTDFVDKLKTGVLLCKLVNAAVPDTIDVRAINLKPVLNAWERNENITLCLNSARAIGCQVVNIGTQDVSEGREHLMLALVAQIVKVHLLSSVNVSAAPELANLSKHADDAPESTEKDSAERLLLRWMNHYLAKANYSKEVKNFSTDLKDGEAYTRLLNQLAPAVCDTSPLQSEGLERAERVLELADKIGCRKFLHAKDILDGHTNLNLAFVANLFNATREGLTAPAEDGSKEASTVCAKEGESGQNIGKAELVMEDEAMALSDEERVYRLWINSVGVSNPVHDLFQDLRDGFVLLEVLERVRPGCVHWGKAHKPRGGAWRGVYKKLENCQQVLDIGRSFKFSLVGIGCDDIVAGRKKPTLSFLWQLMRLHMLSILQQLQKDHELSDADILAWANGMVHGSPPPTDPDQQQKHQGLCQKQHIEGFKDRRLATGLYFLELMAAVEPRVVNWEVVTNGSTDEGRVQNANYIISVARKLGCSTFLVPYDIVKVRPKMILMLLASIMAFHLRRSGGTPSRSSTGEGGGRGLAFGSPGSASPSPGHLANDTPKVGKENSNSKLVFKFEEVVKALGKTPTATTRISSVHSKYANGLFGSTVSESGGGAASGVSGGASAASASPAGSWTPQSKASERSGSTSSGSSVSSPFTPK